MLKFVLPTTGKNTCKSQKPETQISEGKKEKEIHIEKLESDYLPYSCNETSTDSNIKN